MVMRSTLCFMVSSDAIGSELPREPSQRATRQSLRARGVRVGAPRTQGAPSTHSLAAAIPSLYLSLPSAPHTALCTQPSLAPSPPAFVVYMRKCLASPHAQRGRRGQRVPRPLGRWAAPSHDSSHITPRRRLRSTGLTMPRPSHSSRIRPRRQQRPVARRLPSSSPHLASP